MSITKKQALNLKRKITSGLKEKKRLLIKLIEIFEISEEDKKNYIRLVQLGRFKEAEKIIQDGNDEVAVIKALPGPKEEEEQRE